MIQGLITLPGLTLTFVHLFCSEVKDAAGFGIIDQKHSSLETISVLDVLEQRFPVRARRSSPSEISRLQTPGIMRPHARKLSFAPEELEDGNQVENLWNQKTSGIVVPKDQGKITYDHHMNPDPEKERVEWGFMAQMNGNENVSVIPTRSESRESLNLTSQEDSFTSSVTDENSMTQTQTPPKLVFEKNSTNVEISTEGAKNTTMMSLLSPSSRLQLIRPTPSPSATSESQILSNNKMSYLLEKNDEFISNANITTQLKGPNGENVHLNESTTETMQSLGSMSPDDSSFGEMNHHTDNKLSLSSLQTLPKHEDLEDLDELFSFFFEDTKTQRPEQVLLSYVLPPSNETKSLWPPQFKDIPVTRPKSSFMATLASTGILFISVLMLVAFLSQVFFSPPMMKTIVTTTSRPELFVPSNFPPTLNAMARGEFTHSRVQFKQPPRFIQGKQDMRRRLVVRGNKIIPSELFFHPILPLRILQLGKK